MEHKLSTSAQAVLRVLAEATVPMSPREIGEKLGFSQVFANVLLRRELRDTHVTRKMAARSKGGKGGLQYMYWPIDREWPDIPEWDGVTAHQRRAEARRARKLERIERKRRRMQDAAASQRRGALRGSAEGNAEKARLREQRERFPDERFPIGSRAPLTDVEKARLWSWCNRKTA